MTLNLKMNFPNTSSAAEIYTVDEQDFVGFTRIKWVRKIGIVVCWKAVNSSTDICQEMGCLSCCS